MQESLFSLSFVRRRPLSPNMEVMVVEAAVAVASTVAAAFQVAAIMEAAITGEVPATAAADMVTAADTEVFHQRAVTAEEVTAEEEAGPRRAGVVVPLRRDGTRLQDLRREDLQ